MKNLLEYDEVVFNQIEEDAGKLETLDDYKAFAEKYKDFVDCYREKMKFNAIQESVMTEAQISQSHKEYTDKIDAMTDAERKAYYEEHKMDNAIELLVMNYVNIYRESTGQKALTPDYYGE